MTMPLDPNTPVLIGAGIANQRIDDPTVAREPIELMFEALERAAQDAGRPDLPGRADVVRIPRGFPPYPDPGRLIADHFGATARSEVAEIGILQTTLFGRTVRAIAAGEEDVVLVCGGEGKYRALRAQIAGGEATYTEQPNATPDETLRPEGEIMNESELVHGLAMPVSQYALMDNALRHAEGRSIAQHVAEIAELWAGMSRVAAENPDAWIREALTADEIASTDGKNRMLAFPYTRRHNSQWNVDQAAGLIFCRLETARSLGIAEERLLFPRAVTESNHMVPLCERAEMHRSHGFRLAGERAFERAGLCIDDVAHRELYSCFPAAVRMQIRELGVDPSTPITITGGMGFAGGPLNNFVLQAMVAMARVLRAAPGDVGLVTAVSGLMTKQGVSLWSTEPGSEPCVFDDVSVSVASALQRRSIVADYRGRVQIASATVLHEPTGPRAAFVCDTPDGRRTIASTLDAEIASRTASEEVCGQLLEVAPGHVAFV